MDVRVYSVVLLLSLSILNLKGQNKSSGYQIPVESLIQLKSYNDSLKLYNHALINEASEELRSAAAMKIIRTFSKALRLEGAFHYQFDSLSSIAILTPEDKKIRIFTWQLEFDNGTYRYFGVIQSNDAQPKLQPLVDYGDFYEHLDAVIVDADRWIGALYYQIIPFKSGKSTYYALLGWDGNNVLTNRKYIDILWFDKEGKAKFGYPVFEMEDEKNLSRIVLEYKKDAVLSLSYYPEEKQIYFDHLVSLSGNEEPDAFDKVPDGTIEAFRLVKGKWRHVNIIEYQRRQNGEVPNVIKGQTKQLYRPQQKR